MTNTFKRTLACCASAAVLTSGLAGDGAWAQFETDETEVEAAGDGVDTIIVRARKRDESLQDVPVAVAAYGEEILEKGRVEGFQDLEFISPFLEVQESLTPGANIISIRGVSGEGNPSIETSVGFFVDGAYIRNVGSAFTEYVDLESVEILRGPQGTLFGKNTVAGAISVFTQPPEFEFSANGEATFGNYNLRQFRGSVTGPIIVDRLAFRLSAGRTTRDGITTNTAPEAFTVPNPAGLITQFDLEEPQTENEDLNRYLVRGQLLFTPTESFDARLIGYFSRVDEQCCAAIHADPQGPGVLGAIEVDAELEDRLAAYSSANRVEQNTYGVQLNTEWDLGFARFTTINAYNQVAKFNALVDIDSSTIGFLDAGGDDDGGGFTYQSEAQLAGQTGRFDWVGGVFYFTEQGEVACAFSQRTRNIGDQLGLNGLFGLPENTGNGEVVQYCDDTDVRSIAAFGSTDVRLTDRLTVSGGLRYTDESKESRVDSRQYFSAGLPTGLSYLQILDLIPTVTNEGTDYLTAVQSFNPSQSFDDSDIMYDATVKYQFTEDVNAYFRYATGFRSGGTDVDTLRRIATQSELDAFIPVQSEEATSYEVGLRSRLPRSNLTANVTAFWTDITDLQTTFLNSELGFATRGNAGDLRSAGVEVEYAWAPEGALDGLTVSGGAAWNELTTFSPIFDPDTGDVIGVEDEGVFNNGAPRFTVNNTTQYERPIPGFKDISGYVWTNASYRTQYSASDFTDANGLPLETIQDGYFYIDAQGGVLSDRWQLSFWGKNLTNEQVIATGFPVLIDPTFLNPPRTFGVTLQVRY